jgi:hypothetical protein
MWQDEEAFPINPDFEKKYPVGGENSKLQAPNSKQNQKNKIQSHNLMATL